MRGGRNPYRSCAMNSAYPDCASQIRTQPYEVILKGFLWTSAVPRYIWTNALDAAAKGPLRNPFHILFMFYFCLFYLNGILFINKKKKNFHANLTLGQSVSFTACGPPLAYLHDSSPHYFGAICDITCKQPHGGLLGDCSTLCYLD